MFFWLVNLLKFYAKFYVIANIHCSGESIPSFLKIFTICVCVIQNRLKTIVLFYAPVICADVISGVGTLPKAQDLHYALLHWRNILFLFFS